MDDLGEPIEASPEFFSCTAQVSTTLTKAEVSENFVNLLASSSRFGYAVAATNVTLSVLMLADIQNAKSKSTDVDLSAQGVHSVLSIQFILGDTVLLIHAESDGAAVLLLEFPALAAGKVKMLTPPVAAITYGAFSAANPVRTPSSQLIAVLTSAIHIYSVYGTSCEAKAKIDVPGPLSLSFSPSDSFLAIGTQRGCVYIYFTSDASLAVTIVEVESGWIPFAIHFVNEDAVLVTYSKDDNVRYVMWTLEMIGKTVSVLSHFPLGELCLPSPDVHSDQQPNIVFNTIPSWDMCIISSSISTEAEIVAKVKNEWQVWKLDESKSVYLPINEDGDDTFPLGSAMDFNDVIPIEAEDPSSEMIHPMPRFLVLTSDFKILPYSLIDSRAGMVCDLVRPPTSLPALETFHRPVEQISFPDFSRGNESSARSCSGSEFSNELARNEGESQLSTAVEASFSKASDMFGFTKLSNDLKTIALSPAVNDYPKESSEQGSVSTESTDTSKASFSAHGPDLSAPKRQSPLQSISRTSVPEVRMKTVHADSELAGQRIRVEDCSFENGNDGSPCHTALRNVPTRQAFSESGPFLSQFYSKKKTEGCGSSTAETGRAGRNIKTSSLFPEQAEERLKREPESVSLQPSLDQAFTIASSGEGIDLIKSMLCEMSEELAINRKAGAVLTTELKSQSQALLSRLETTRNALNEMMESTMARFRKEAILRKEVGETLKHILRISRAYETLALELQVEDATGLSRSLKPEDIAMDEQISSKEAGIVKSLASIEGRLAEEAAPKKYQSSTDVIREIYASLSLQGIRIRRVLELLQSLSQRLEEHDQGGRQSSLGLSLARLEQLNLEDTKPHVTVKSQEEQSFGIETPQTSEKTKGLIASSSIIPDEGHELFPPKIDALLRKLAMSGGRELICPRGQKLSIDGEITQNNTLVNRIHHEDTPSSQLDKAGESQMIEVKSLLDGIDHSSELQATTEIQPSSASSLLRTDTQLVSKRNLTSLHTKRSNKKVGHEESPVMSVPHALESRMPSSDTMMQKSSNQKRKMGSEETIVGRLPETPFHGKESHFGLEGNKRQNEFPSFGLPKSHQFETRVNSSSLQNIEPLDKTTPREASRSSFASGQWQEHKPASKSTAFAAVPNVSFDDSGVLDKGRIAENEWSDNLRPSAMQNTSSGHCSPSPGKAKKKEIQFAGLPPDDFDSVEKKSLTPLAGLPPKPPFASLPPDDFGNTEKVVRKAEVQFASLPPDGSQRTMKPESLEPNSENKKSVVELGQTMALKPTINRAKGDTSNESAPKGNSYEESISTEVASSRIGSALKSPSGTPQSNLVINQSQHSTKNSNREPSNSIFGGMDSSSVNTFAPSSFGRSSIREESTESNVLGTSSLAPSSAGALMSSSFHAQQSVSNQEGMSMFGAAMQMNRPGEGNKSEDGGSPIAATDSEDSDNDNIRQGMDTSMGTSSHSGSHGFSNPTTTGGSLFGQAFSSAFGKPVSGAQLFAQSSSQMGAPFGIQQLNASPGSFRTPNANPMGANPGLQSSPFGASASFGMTSSIGEAPVFGALSAIGTPSTTFGNASPIGAQSSPFAMPVPRFGESSFGKQSTPILGLGVSSAGMAGGSPFGALATGTGFGKSSGSASGFAALAGNSNGLVFGNGGGPPAFTSAAFTERRA
ncbi:unnamed protein product [Agarophyton chilense]